MQRHHNIQDDLDKKRHIIGSTIESNTDDLQCHPRIPRERLIDVEEGIACRDVIDLALGVHINLNDDKISLAYYHCNRWNLLWNDGWLRIFEGCTNKRYGAIGKKHKIYSKKSASDFG